MVTENITVQDLLEGLPSRVHAVYERFAREIRTIRLSSKRDAPGATGSFPRRSRRWSTTCASCRSGPAIG